MLTRETMRGLYALPPTPFTPDGEFDEDSFRQNVRTLVEAGVDAVVTTGSNGEFHTMRWEMLERLIPALVEETPDHVMAVAGCSAVHTEEAIRRTRFAMECGADAVMNVSPFYIELTQRELIGFWQELSGACPDIGIIVYNNVKTAQLHDIPVFKALAKLPNICGSKEGHTNYTLMMDLMHETDLAHMTSTELDWFVSTMHMGAKGVFSMSASIFPRYMVKLMNTCKEGRWDDAIRMQRWLRIAWDSLRDHPALEGYHMIAKFKAFVNAAGHLKCGKNRKPFISVTDEHQAALTEYCQRELADLVNV
ncbi:MAG TPA: dihydrodipicolinate synthase family protein [Candidatus Hydrogenedentes bacterium]|nr:dihydrodipicolinate synthase family protein [Candidatus Hydrogenedentota bacterium]HIJ74188.1 dihydrodipicolinate synthase family protein [Candidatus Hydrogenedentota bacterium]